MKDYYIISSGSIKRKDNTIYYYDLEGDKKALPIEQVDDIHIYGEVDLNTKLINYISRYGVMLHFYNYYGFVIQTGTEEIYLHCFTINIFGYLDDGLFPLHIS